MRHLAGLGLFLITAASYAALYGWPLHAPALAGWAIALAGLALLVWGLASQADTPDGPPLLPSVLCAAISALMLHEGVAYLALRGVCFATLAGVALNGFLFARDLFWWDGYCASGVGTLTAGEAEELAEENKQMLAALEDVGVILRWPGVVRGLRALLHPDRARSESERGELEELSKKLAVLFDRTGAN